MWVAAATTTPTATGTVNAASTGTATATATVPATADATAAVASTATASATVTICRGAVILAMLAVLTLNPKPFILLPSSLISSRVLVWATMAPPGQHLNHKGVEHKHH